MLINTYPSFVSTNYELNSLVENHIINTSIIIEGDQIETLSGIVEIHGDLGLFNSSLSSLGDLEKVTGSIWVWDNERIPTVKSLGKLKYVGGNLYFRIPSLLSVGELVYVGGNAKFSGTNIKDLGKIQYIGGSLQVPDYFFYPLRYQFTNINVKTDITYWHNKASKKPFYIVHTSNLSRIPFEFYDPSDESLKSIQDAALYAFSKFDDEIYFDIPSSVLYELAEVMYRDFCNSKDIVKLDQRLSILGELYPPTCTFLLGSDTNPLRSKYLYQAYNLLDQKEQAFNAIANTVSYTYELRYYELEVGKSLISPDIALAICKKKGLTSFGRKYIDQIKPYISRELKKFEKEHHCGFLDLFFTDDKPYKIIEQVDASFCPEYYKQFFKNLDDYEDCKNFKYPSDWPCWDYTYRVVSHAVKAVLETIIRRAENSFRKKVGFTKIGQGNNMTEMEFYFYLVERFPNEFIVPHAVPSWLGNQHIDIYFPDRNFGIEYQGQQHYKPIDYFGGEEGFNERMELDKRKAEKCKENGCFLFYPNTNNTCEDMGDVIKTFLSLFHCCP